MCLAGRPPRSWKSSSRSLSPPRPPAHVWLAPGRRTYDQPGSPHATDEPQRALEGDVSTISSSASRGRGQRSLGHPQPVRSSGGYLAAKKQSRSSGGRNQSMASGWLLRPMMGTPRVAGRPAFRLGEVDGGLPPWQRVTVMTPTGLSTPLITFMTAILQVQGLPKKLQPVSRGVFCVVSRWRQRSRGCS